MTEGVGHFHAQIIWCGEEGHDAVGLDTAFKIVQFRFAGFILDPFWQPGLIFFVYNKAIDGLAKFFGMQIFHLGDGNIGAIRNISIAMGINANEQVAFFNFFQAGFQGFIWTRTKYFHFDGVITGAFYGFDGRGAIFDQVFVCRANEYFHRCHLSLTVFILQQNQKSGVYNHDMARKIRLLLAILILTLSLALLVWGLWPNLVETRIVPVEPGQMQLPTPVSLLYGSDWLAMSTRRNLYLLLAGLVLIAASLACGLGAAPEAMPPPAMMPAEPEARQNLLLEPPVAPDAGRTSTRHPRIPPPDVGIPACHAHRRLGPHPLAVGGG